MSNKFYPPKKINIFGNVYNFEMVESFPDDRDGDCSWYEKKIRYLNPDSIIDISDEAKTAMLKEVISHEVWHAILYELGLVEYGMDETLIYALGATMPKILKIFRKANLI